MPWPDGENTLRGFPRSNYALHELSLGTRPNWQRREEDLEELARGIFGQHKCSA